MPACRLHIPWRYDPRRDEIRCDCGAVVLSRLESDDTGRWRGFFPTPRPEAP